MLGSTSADPPSEGSRASPWLVAVLAALVAASFAAGALVFGLGGDDRAPVRVAAEGTCRERPLRFGLGEHPDTQARIARAERAPVPEAGFYTAAGAPPAIEVLHAGSHGFVVVRYAAQGDALARLRRLIRRKAQDEAVLAVPAAPGAPALSGVMWGRELRCTAAGDRELRSLERFIDSLYGAG